MDRAYFLVPHWIDDPSRPSGGNTYDRRVARELAALGRQVVEIHAPDDVTAVPDGAVLLADALVACAHADTLVAACARVHVVVLAHMPFPGCAVLRAAAAVVTTSAWTRDAVLADPRVAAHKVHVAEPGADRAAIAPGTGSGARLLCVGAVTPAKGHDVLLDALAGLSDQPWRCTCVGPLDRDAPFAAAVQRRPVAGRVDFPGPRAGAALDATYAGADLLVLPSRTEAYGMVVTEALARGVPVVATDVGGVREALGTTATGRPGLLVPPQDAAALAAALRRWLTEPRLRRELRATALERRSGLSGWSRTARRIAGVLATIERN